MASAILDQLTQQIRAIETGGSRHQGESISSGCGELDGWLPDEGYRPGTIVEWLEVAPGCGGYYLAMATARHAIAAEKYLVIVDPERRFYPPAARAMGIALERLIVVHPQCESDCWWSLDQVLRCSAVGAVVSPIKHLSELQARRFQLAAEQGQVLGCWLRPASIQRMPSWAEVQWLIEPVCSREIPSRSSIAENQSVRRVGLRALRMRGGTVGSRCILRIDTQSGHIAMEKIDANSSSLHLAAQLAMPKTERMSRQRTGAATVRAASA